MTDGWTDTRTHNYKFSIMIVLLCSIKLIYGWIDFLGTKTVSNTQCHTYLESPQCDADHERYLYDDDDELGDYLWDEELSDIDSRHPGAVQESLVTLHHQRNSCQANRDAKSDTAWNKCNSNFLDTIIDSELCFSMQHWKLRMMN